MPRPRFLKADPERREAVLRAATAEFAREGWEGASVNRVVAAAKLSKGALYYWFDDKADLAGAVLERATVVLADALVMPVIAKTKAAFWSEMRRSSLAAIDLLVRYPQETEAFVKLGLAAEKDPALGRVFAPILASRVQYGAELLATGQRLGVVRTDLPIGVLFGLMAATKQVLTRALLPRDRTSDRAQLGYLTDVVIDLARRQLSPAPTPRKRPPRPPTARTRKPRTSSPRRGTRR